MKLHAVAVMALAFAFMAGCTQQSSDAEKTGENVAALQSTVRLLSRQVQALTDRVTINEGNISRLQIEQAASDRSKAYFDPTDSSYQRIDPISGVGTFAVAVRTFRAFGDGVRVTLALGNLSSATIDGATLNLAYGPRRPPAPPPFPSAEDTQKLAAWQRAMQFHTQQIVVPLRPGSWNPVTVTLPQINPRKFGFLEVEISTSQISLYQ